MKIAVTAVVFAMIMGVAIEAEAQRGGRRGRRPDGTAANNYQTRLEAQKKQEAEQTRKLQIQKAENFDIKTIEYIERYFACINQAEIRTSNQREQQMYAALNTAQWNQARILAKKNASAIGSIIEQSKQQTRNTAGVHLLAQGQVEHCIVYLAHLKNCYGDLSVTISTQNTAKIKQALALLEDDNGLAGDAKSNAENLELLRAFLMQGTVLPVVSIEEMKKLDIAQEQILAKGVLPSIDQFSRDLDDPNVRYIHQWWKTMYGAKGELYEEENAINDEIRLAFDEKEWATCAEASRRRATHIETRLRAAERISRKGLHRNVVGTFGRTEDKLNESVKQHRILAKGLTRIGSDNAMTATVDRAINKLRELQPGLNRQMKTIGYINLLVCLGADLGDAYAGIYKGPPLTMKQALWDLNTPPFLPEPLRRPLRASEFEYAKTVR